MTFVPGWLRPRPSQPQGRAGRYSPSYPATCGWVVH